MLPASGTPLPCALCAKSPHTPSAHAILSPTPTFPTFFPTSTYGRQRRIQFTPTSHTVRQVWPAAGPQIFQPIASAIGQTRRISTIQTNAPYPPSPTFPTKKPHTHGYDFSLFTFHFSHSGVLPNTLRDRIVQLVQLAVIPQIALVQGHRRLVAPDGRTGLGGSRAQDHRLLHSLADQRA